MSFDALLLLGYGGPEKPADIRPFLRNVAKGRPIPGARLEAVARHYEIIGGRSPLNEYTRAQAEALASRLKEAGHDLVPYVGMRHWRPMIPDTLRRMRADGRRRVVGLIMAAHQSESSWTQYQRDVADALDAAGGALEIVYTDPIFDHPRFIEAAARHVTACFARISREQQEGTRLVFTAHSIPAGMAARCPYEAQLMTSCRLVAERLKHPHWQLAYQSRSGRPRDPWLEPDVGDALRRLAVQGVRTAVLMPIGFLCDHAEVLYDLDYEAAAVAREAGVTLYRAEGMNLDPLFIEALADRVLNVVGAPSCRKEIE